MSDVPILPSNLKRSYPRVLRLDRGVEVAVRWMTSLDVHRIVAFARALPERDLQFLRVDITRMLAVMLWVQNINAGKTMTLLAEKNGELAGYASLHNDQVSWQRHLGELRVQVGAPWRGLGLGQALAREIFAVAPEMGLKKIVGQMPPGQTQAISLLERAGFKQEAVLHGFVIDRTGHTSDLVVMTCDVDALPRAPD